MEFKIIRNGATWQWLERSQMWVADMESRLGSLGDDSELTQVS